MEGGGRGGESTDKETARSEPGDESVELLASVHEPAGTTTTTNSGDAVPRHLSSRAAAPTQGQRSRNMKEHPSETTNDQVDMVCWPKWASSPSLRTPARSPLARLLPCGSCLVAPVGACSSAASAATLFLPSFDPVTTTTRCIAGAPLGVGPSQCCCRPSTVLPVPPRLRLSVCLRRW